MSHYECSDPTCSCNTPKPEPKQLRAEAYAHLTPKGKIHQIKAIREDFPGIGLLEAKTIVDMWWERGYFNTPFKFTVEFHKTTRGWIGKLIQGNGVVYTTPVRNLLSSATEDIEAQLFNVMDAETHRS